MSKIWEIITSESPLVAAAIHDGHFIRDGLDNLVAISEKDRLREEDPYTGYWTEVAKNRIVGIRSRFEVDLNRPREKAVYRTPEDAWGLQVWKSPTDSEHVQHSLAQYNAFYQTIEKMLTDIEAQFRKFALSTINYSYLETMIQ